MKLGRVLFAAGAAGLAAAVVVATHRHPAAAGPPTETPAAAASSSTGGIGWLALPAAVLVVICVVGAVLAYRHERTRPRTPTRRVHEHWHVILNAQPAAGGPWVVVRRGHRQQRASRIQVATDVEAEARAINPELRYRADVVEAQPNTVR